MDPEAMWKTILLVICLFFSGIFSASETALMSLSKIRVKQMVENKEKGADRINKLLSDPSKLLSAILIGNNIVNIGASSLLTSLAIDYYGSTGVGIATGVMTLLILIFGEITPKSLAAQNSEKVSLRLSGLIRIVTIIFSPAIFVLTRITNMIIKIMGGDVNKHQPFITQEELKTIVNVSHKEGVLEGEEKEMIYNVFDFSDSQARDVMTPRTDMVAIDINLPYEDMINIFKQEQYSRIPVYEDTIDNIIGILYVKDLLFLQDNKTKFDLKGYLREPYFTYEFKSTKQLFEEMRTDRIHMAIVLDEYGGTEGLVTIEDLIEEIVGEIEDEYDKEINEIEVIKEDEYLVYGNVKIDVINELIGTSIESEDFDSIGGFIIGVLGNFPEAKETIEYDNIKFIVESINRNKIEKVRIIT
ncbi:HlyC/CorC family transporter [Lachnospiraceae bacterium NSJ-29]|uniref:HlyC/CorC family transporter n=2 Tax=Wansuia hejianensis TaxID=2763667 RepID=A0A926EVU2_9FIRM|nr:hemolysin family protein [Wansuia hejianensis]MBC8589841.1 HlyC/CorC family transporter [Wansuia hejianensis]